MFAISIHDFSDGALSFDLVDIVDLDRAKVRSSRWKCSRVEALGRRADELEEVSVSGKFVSGDTFFQLAHKFYQIIDGDFVEALPEAASPWIVIRAIDSSCFVVLTDDQNFFEAIKIRFGDVRDSPDDLAWFDHMQG